ncbi:hypothetical protein D770_12470 [Flammeovirgaceae bacterium 311]|nr:hypothetical protein D770_12470 [Flammeovirgaceae bacterium 311]
MKNCFRTTVLSILLLFTAVTFASAQDYRYKAKVVLMNGDVINGRLSEPWSGGNLYLYVSENTLLEINSSDIRKLKQEQLNGKKSSHSLNKLSDRGAYGRQEGFYHHAFAGLSFGEHDTNASLGMVNGYRFNKLVSLGLGVNYDRFDQASALPIYLQPRLHLKNDKLSLYCFTDLGYSPAWQNKGVGHDMYVVNTTGGLMGQAGMGYQLNFAKSALNFTLGYKLQKIEVHSEVYNYYYTEPGGILPSKIIDIQEKRLIRRVAFTVGLML